MARGGKKTRRQTRIIIQFILVIFFLPLSLMAQEPIKTHITSPYISAHLFAFKGSHQPDQTYLAADGLLSGNGLIEDSDQSLSFPGYSNWETSDDADPFNSNLRLYSGTAIDKVFDYFFKYLTLNDDTTDKTDEMDYFFNDKGLQPNSESDTFGLDLFVNVGYDDKSMAKMDAVEVVAYWFGTVVNAVYHCDEKEFLLGFSSSKINQTLPDGMFLEMKVNPETGSSALMFTIDL